MIRLTLVLALALSGCSVATNEAIEMDMRGGKTFCEAYPEVPACGQQTEGYTDDTNAE